MKEKIERKEQELKNTVQQIQQLTVTANMLQGQLILLKELEKEIEDKKPTKAGE